jgi:hypothetical protein
MGATRLTNTASPAITGRGYQPIRMRLSSRKT